MPFTPSPGRNQTRGGQREVELPRRRQSQPHEARGKRGQVRHGDGAAVAKIEREIDEILHRLIHLTDAEITYIEITLANTRSQAPAMTTTATSSLVTLRVAQRIGDDDGHAGHVARQRGDGRRARDIRAAAAELLKRAPIHAVVGSDIQGKVVLMKNVPAAGGRAALPFPPQRLPARPYQFAGL